MLQVQSWVNISDGTNIIWLRLFRLYGGSYRHATHEGLFVKGSAQVVKPPVIEYKGFKRKFYYKGSVARGLIVRTTRQLRYLDGSTRQLKQSSVILIRFRQTLKSKYFYGLVSRRINRRRFLALFPNKIS